jgi:solute carrier family 13 (sodium-dependent dicarboxylate transporter), member 2/3/5
MTVNYAVVGKRTDPKILLIDDETRFRKALAQQLVCRDFCIMDTDNGEDAIKIIRHNNPEIVILDQNMPGMDGIQTLKEIKRVKPEVQVIMHTGHGSTELARVTGKHDVFAFIEKPCAIENLVEVITAALEARSHAMAKHEIPEIKKAGIKERLIGAHNARPGIIALGAVLFLLLVCMPTPRSLEAFLTQQKQGVLGEPVAGYAQYSQMKNGQTISAFYAQKAKLYNKTKGPDGHITKTLITADQVALRAKVMIGVLVVAALFWATGAMPIGITALLVGVLMYFFGVFTPSDVAMAYAKDSVIFIFGVLALAAAISKTGLDRRIGIVLLGTSTSLWKFGLIFAPLLAVTASFLSEHALVAFIAPILMLVYMGAIKAAGLQKDKHLVVMLMLMLTFCGNIGGPGSPAAGGRNAVMLGILADYNVQVSFGEWVKLGLPFVPVMALVIAAYFLLLVRKKMKLKSINIAQQVRRESEKLGKMTPDEYKAGAVLILLVILWTTLSDRFGMGGPVLLSIVVLSVLGILRWRDINNIHWDVVALYAAASAMGYGLAATGAALWLASGLVALLPEAMKSGTGLYMSTSLITGILTNFMSDGATVAAIGPITVPMATLSHTSPLLVGLSTAFASSFAHMLVIGTPNNAIVFSVARDPETGEQLITMKDFLIHGGAIFVLSMAVLWLWTFLGYWRWMGY